MPSLNLEELVRTGAAGWWDRLVGPGSSALENLGTVGLFIIGALAGDSSVKFRAHSIHRLVLRLATADLLAGAWTNNCPSTVAWYQRPGQGLPEHLGFAALHLVHPMAVAYVDHAGGLRTAQSAARWALGHYAWMLTSSAIVVAAPRRPRLAIAAAATTVGLILDRCFGRSDVAPWFAPLYYGKLVLGHAAGSIWGG